MCRHPSGGRASHTLNTVQCYLYTVQYSIDYSTVYCVICILYSTVQITVRCTVQFVYCTVQYRLQYSVQCNLCTVQYTIDYSSVFDLLCILYTVQYTSTDCCRVKQYSSVLPVQCSHPVICKIPQTHTTQRTVQCNVLQCILLYCTLYCTVQ